MYSPKPEAEPTTQAQAQVTAIFTKVILATTETSATTNAMNFPLDSAERLLNQAGQMR